MNGHFWKLKPFIITGNIKLIKFFLLNWIWVLGEHWFIARLCLRAPQVSIKLITGESLLQWLHKNLPSWLINVEGWEINLVPTYKQNNKTAITLCTVLAEICNLCVTDLDNVSEDFQRDAAIFLKFEVLSSAFILKKPQKNKKTASYAFTAMQETRHWKRKKGGKKMLPVKNSLTSHNPSEWELFENNGAWRHKTSGLFLLKCYHAIDHGDTGKSFPVCFKLLSLYFSREVGSDP